MQSVTYCVRAARQVDLLAPGPVRPPHSQCNFLMDNSFKFPTIKCIVRQNNCTIKNGIERGSNRDTDRDRDNKQYVRFDCLSCWLSPGMGYRLNQNVSWQPLQAFQFLPQVCPTESYINYCPSKWRSISPQANISGGVETSVLRPGVWLWLWLWHI